MASSKAYFDFILEQLSELEEITYRTMMGEYIIYYRGRIVGGIYDDRLLVKPVKSAISLIPDTNYEMTNNILMEILESQNDLAIIIALVEWEALIEQEEIDAYWTNANSWILLYQIVLKNPDKRSEFMRKLSITHNEGFYNVLFEKQFSFYKNRI